MKYILTTSRGLITDKSDVSSVAEEERNLSIPLPQLDEKKKQNVPEICPNVSSPYQYPLFAKVAVDLSSVG